MCYGLKACTRQIQVITKQESRKYPTLGIALPVIDDACKQFRNIPLGGEYFDRRGELVRPLPDLERLAQSFLELFPRRLNLHSLYTVACLMQPHPSMNSLSCISLHGAGFEAVFNKTKQELKAEELTLLRRLCASTRAVLPKKVGSPEKRQLDRQLEQVRCRTHQP